MQRLALFSFEVAVGLLVLGMTGSVLAGWLAQCALIKAGDWLEYGEF